MTISLFNIYLEHGSQGLTQQGKRTALKSLAGIIGGVVAIALLSCGLYFIAHNGYAPVIPFWCFDGLGLITAIVGTGSWAQQLFGNLSDESIKKYISHDPPNHGKPKKYTREL